MVTSDQNPDKPRQTTANPGKPSSHSRHTKWAEARLQSGTPAHYAHPARVLRRQKSQVRILPGASSGMAVDLVIDIENTPGALAEVAAAISDAGVNIAAATCIGPGERAELHILVPHAEAARHLLAISHVAVTREREVVVVDVDDRPGVLADLSRRIARAGVNLDLVYVATRNRVVFGAADLDALRAALGTG
jgi:hypothetical protein